MTLDQPEEESWFPVKLLEKVNPRSLASARLLAGPELLAAAALLADTTVSMSTARLDDTAPLEISDTGRDESKHAATNISLNSPIITQLIKYIHPPIHDNLVAILVHT